MQTLHAGGDGESAWRVSTLVTRSPSGGNRHSVSTRASACEECRTCSIADARPWIAIDQAAGRADTLAEVIRRCPSGALHTRRLDGEANEAAAAPVTVAVQRDGPLYVRGDLEIRDASGGMIRREVRAALCRCGDSANKPFCDNSHIAAGFQAP